VLRIPDNIPLDAAAPLLCAGTTGYSPVRHWKAGPGTKVAVVGRAASATWRSNWRAPWGRRPPCCPSRSRVPARVSLLMRRISYAGSPIGGVRETQEVLDCCAEHGIAAQIDTIRAEQIDEAYEQVVDPTCATAS
jgi:D-arabinose 1-dehydrogenase-like Zn-dependent alcohol dehydrogenase